MLIFRYKQLFQDGILPSPTQLNNRPNSGKYHEIRTDLFVFNFARQDHVHTGVYCCTDGAKIFKMYSLGSLDIQYIPPIYFIRQSFIKPKTNF